MGGSTRTIPVTWSGYVRAYSRENTRLTRDDVGRRTAQGRTKMEIIRCLNIGAALVRGRLANGLADISACGPRAG